MRARKYRFTVICIVAFIWSGCGRREQGTKDVSPSIVVGPVVSDTGAVHRVQSLAATDTIPMYTDWTDYMGEEGMKRYRCIPTRQWPYYNVIIAY